VERSQRPISTISGWDAEEREELKQVTLYSFTQFCGSGSGIRCLIDPWIRDGYKIKIRIRDEHPGSYFRELRNSFFG
jgi:hypothetical protein